MNLQQKFQACLRQARDIVTAHRAQVPAGCDPQNTWVAVAVGVASIAYSAYNSSQANSAIEDANNKLQHSFKPVDFNSLERNAVSQDTGGYKQADIDWAKRFPLLTLGRKAEIDQASGDLKSNQVDPQLAAGLGQAGLSLKGGNAFQQARDLGLKTTALRDRNRNFFSSMLAENPERSFGLTGQDAAQVSMANTNSKNIIAGAITGSNINAYNSMIAQNAQNNNLLLGLGSTALANQRLTSGSTTNNSTPYIGSFSANTGGGD